MGMGLGVWKGVQGACETEGFVGLGGVVFGVLVVVVREVRSPFVGEGHAGVGLVVD